MPAAAAPEAGPPAAGDAAMAAPAKAKKCGKGKTLVRRKGRKSVCAKKCKAGFRHKVGAKGKVTCARRPRRGASPKGTGGPAAGNYTGNTAQNRTISFTVAGGQVTNFQAGVNTYCSTQGNSRFVTDAIANIPPMPIGPDGSFKYTGPSDAGNPEIAGRIVGGKATGTVGMFRGDSNFVPGEGLKFGSCSASGVTWSAAGG